jgi:hypothetical protein
MLGRVRYRIRQFMRGFRGRLSNEEIEAVRSLLTDRELSLFTEMDRRDQRHSVDLLRHLERSEAGPSSSELRRAALLHDVGKGRLSVGARVLFVLANAVAPALARRFEREGARGLRGAFWRIRYHASLGALRLAELGVEEGVIELVRYHTAEERRSLPRRRANDPDLLRLIESDEAT